jgi:UDP-N-acetylglucosamine 2-epimerase (non-hydrolysing)
MIKVLAIFGTRPEAIKMAPVILELDASDQIDIRICVTAQHRAMLDQALSLFELVPDHDLDLMQHDQTLEALTSRALTGVGAILDIEKPDVVLVHGDTSTTLAASLAAFYRRVSVGHVEAGLRSGSLAAPWPEEMNRRVVTLTTRYHFAPTDSARRNLLAEGVPDQHIHVTGNTVIDALLRTVARARLAGTENLLQRFAFLAEGRPLVLVTGHRRENFGTGFDNICAALIEIAEHYDAHVVYPIHPNPNVKGPVERRLAGNPRISLIDPLEYLHFIALMDRAHFVITDSGGVQEEAPSLGKPVLVMRDTTERPEAVQAGTAILVGTDRKAIVREAGRLFTDKAHYARMAGAINPYGDGMAAGRICRALEKHERHA